MSTESVWAWLSGRIAGDHIEDVNMGMLDRLVAGVQPGMDPLFSKTFSAFSIRNTLVLSFLKYTKKSLILFMVFYAFS